MYCGRYHAFLIMLYELFMECVRGKVIIIDLVRDDDLYNPFLVRLPCPRTAAKLLPTN